MNAEALLVRLAWALVHFLWQGALLGVVAWGVLALLRRRRPEVRYAAACLFLGGCLALPLLTFLVQGMPAVMPTAEVARTAGYQAVMSLRRLVVGHLPLLLGLWGLGSLILGLRAGASWLWLARLERRATEVMDAQLLHLLERLEARLGLTKPVRLMTSERVRGPFVHGLWRPIVFVPVGFVTGLDPKALEAVLAHELAHVRRLDVLVIGLQTVIETLLYYHPVTWWLSHRVSTEREHCCDAFAVEACGDPVLLAKTLSRFADLAQAGAPALAGGDLMERIQRILNLESGPARFPAPLLSAGLALSATVLLAQQPELRELVFHLPAQGRQVALQVQGVAAAVQQPLPEPVETATRAGADPAGIHETSLPAPAGDPMPQPQEALEAAPAPKAKAPQPITSIPLGRLGLPRRSVLGTRVGTWPTGAEFLTEMGLPKAPLELDPVFGRSDAAGAYAYTTWPVPSRFGRKLVNVTVPAMSRATFSIKGESVSGRDGLFQLLGHPVSSLMPPWDPAMKWLGQSPTQDKVEVENRWASPRVVMLVITGPVNTPYRCDRDIRSLRGLPLYEEAVPVRPWEGDRLTMDAAPEGRVLDWVRTTSERPGAVSTGMTQTGNRLPERGKGWFGLGYLSSLQCREVWIQPGERLQFEVGGIDRVEMEAYAADDEVPEAWRRALEAANAPAALERNRSLTVKNPTGQPQRFLLAAFQVREEASAYEIRLTRKRS